MNYLQRKKMAFMSIINSVKGFIRKVVGTSSITLPDCLNEDSLINMQIYGNSVQDGTPAPDNPVEIESVGELSKNLFNTDWLTTAFTVHDDGITFSTTGYAVDTNCSADKFLEETGLKPGDTITIKRWVKKNHNTGNNYGAVGKIVFLKRNASSDFSLCNSNSYLTNNREDEAIDILTVTIPEDFNSENYLSLYIYGCSPKAENTLTEFRISIVKGEEACDFEPYGKYKIPVKARGKNLFDKNDYNVVNDSGHIGFSCKNLEIGKTYTLSSNKPFTWLKISNKTGGYNSVAKTQYSGMNHVTFTMARHTNISEENTQFMFIQYATSSTESKWLSDIAEYDGVNFMLTEGEEICDFEPYIEPQTFNIFTNEPLRKVGDYADVVDFKGKLLTRIIDKMALNSSVALHKSAAVKNARMAVYFGVPNVNPFTKSETDVLSNYFPSIKGYQWADYGVYRAGITSSNRYHFILAPNEVWGIDENDTTDDLKLQKIRDWLSVRNVEVYFHLETPTEEQIYIPKLPTFKGTTVYEIENITPTSKIEAEYYSSTKGA